MAKVSAVYDRASLVALPPEMRERYASHLASILPHGTRVLLVTFDYPQAEMQGPPFAVSVQEVEALYGKYADIRLLAQEDALEQNPRFKQRGMSRLQENIFLLTLK
jgi:thiopurine S-methyltransferase